jgi:hypothetical protein
MSTQVQNEVPALSINQRNLYLYYLNHKRKHPRAPCFVPKVSVQENCMADYLKILEHLEKMNLIRVDRTSDNYTGWIIFDPQR